MKFTLSWLRTHLDTDASLEVITETLTRIGLELEGVEDRGAALAPFRIVHVIEAVQHPNADRLRACKVDTGSGIVSVVCGAPNARTGMKAVLGQPEALKRLNAIVHPLVGRDRVAFFQKAEADRADLVVLDIPLLFETGGHAHVDAIVVVSAPAEMQRERVLARPGMSPERLDAILSQQLADPEKQARAHFVVDTSRGLEPARAQVAEIIAALRDPQFKSARDVPAG